MSIATEITRLQNIKADIRSALVTKGVSTADSHNMADFPEDILSISGGSEVVAFIVVTYPAGSTCTCSNGPVTLTATDTSGKFAFGVPSVGSWIITSSLGGDYAIANVGILTVGQSESVELTYRVPSLYQEVEFLKSSGTQYINTGIVPSMGRLEVDAIYHDSSSNASRVIVGQGDSGKSDVEIYFYNNLPYGAYGLGMSSGTATYIGNTSVPNGTRFQATISNRNGTVTLTNSKTTNTATKTGQGSATSSTRPLYLFGRNNSGSAVLSSVTLYSFRVYNMNEELTHEFVPCYRKTDYVAGMWDVIGKAFYTNAGSGTFVVGGNV